MVAEAGHRRAGGDPEARLDHAAEHHSEPERPRRVGHAHALADAARLGELDVDRRARSARRRRRRRACGSPRRRRSGSATDLLQLRPVRIARAAAAARSTRPRAPPAAGSASSASSSDQDSFTSTWSGTSVTSRTARTRSTSRPSPPPSFSFSRRKRPLACACGGLLRHLVRRGEPDRPRGRRPEPLEPEEAPDRLAGELPAEVVQRGVDRRARRELLGRQPAASPPRARTGRRRGRPPRTPRRRAPTRRTRRSGRSAPPRRSRRPRRGGSRPRPRRPCPATRARS